MHECCFGVENVCFLPLTRNIHWIGNMLLKSLYHKQSRQGFEGKGSDYISLLKSRYLYLVDIFPMYCTENWNYAS